MFIEVEEMLCVVKEAILTTPSRSESTRQDHCLVLGMLIDYNKDLQR